MFWFIWFIAFHINPNCCSSTSSATQSVNDTWSIRKNNANTLTKITNSQLKKDGASALRRAASGKKQNSSGKLKTLLGKRRLRKLSDRHKVMKLKVWEVSRYFWECLPKVWNGISDFREDFYLHMVLLKQHLLELPFTTSFSRKRHNPPPPAPHRTIWQKQREGGNKGNRFPCCSLGWSHHGLA